MFVRLAIAGLTGLLALPSSAFSASFDLTPGQGDEFILSPANQKAGGVSVYPDGARDLELEEVIDLSCEHGTYAIPVVKAYVETGVSWATRREYFVYERRGADYVPGKSILSVHAVDRQTGEAISEPWIEVEREARAKQLCDSIPEETAADQPVWPADQ